MTEIQNHSVFSEEKKNLFWTVCIPIRIALVVLVYNRIFPNVFVAIGLACIGISFFTVYVFKLRMNAPESSRTTTWWHEYRVYHGALYILAAILSLFDQRLAAIPLLIDVILGISLQIFANNGWHDFNFVRRSRQTLLL
jgi:xanthine/uracil permease